MLTSEAGDDLIPALHEGAFSGRLAFQQIIRDALRVAAQTGWRSITLCDASFEDWPLGERAVIESLQAWSKTGRTLTILAKRFDTLRTTHHRFVAWRGQWSHIIEARGVPDADPADFPSGVYSPHWVMLRLDPVRSNGVCTLDAQRRIAMREMLQEWHAKSSPAFAATTLGL